MVSLRNPRRRGGKIWNWRKLAFVCYNNPVKQEHIGSTFDDFLKQEGLLAQCEAGALKRVVVWQTDPKCQKSRRHAVLALHDSTLQLAVSEESHSLASPSSAAFDSPCTEYHPLSHESRFPFSKIRAEPSAGESLRTGRQCSC